MNFADRLMEKIDQKQSHVCVGLDPRLDRIPEQIKQKALERCGKTIEAAAWSLFEFNCGIIDAIKEHAPVVKPQLAFYELYGSAGVEAFEKTVDYAKKQDLLVLTDGKRNDIGSTAQAYADAYLGQQEIWKGKKLKARSDALTVTPYLGHDGIAPFLKNCEEYVKGIFILVKTSNLSAGDLQDLELSTEDKLYQRLAKLVVEWGQDSIGQRGYSSVGTVVGATYPQEAERLREIMPQNYFLVPGYGAQGGGAEDVLPAFNDDGYGAVVNSSRGIIFAYQEEQYSDDYQQAAEEAVIKMKETINQALAGVDKLVWS
ncbi:orotidine-5'-phosphate decarboxylase [Natroniella sp. ANB-PHB2]|uniref:orotidine-5'-phosphate decarboxylase n=1 Tax=Natroniella sp. ANB-PHB2 TaxID=3384444 RepID=UPI0038D44050